MRQRLAQAWIELEIMRYNALRGLSRPRPGPGPPRAIDRQAVLGHTGTARLGDLAMDCSGRGPARRRRPARRPHAAQRLFLFTRADTIYGGSNQIQRNIIGERVLGLPPEPKVV